MICEHFWKPYDCVARAQPLRNGTGPLHRNTSVWIDPLEKIPPELAGGVVAIGNFEGVHRGHCRLLARLRERARAIGAPAVAVSFDPHPIALLRPEFAPIPLQEPHRKEEILLASGADAVAIIRTSLEFLQLSADEFFDRFVRAGFSAKGMVEGRNFGYGRDRAGNIPVLARECQAAGIPLDVVDIVTGEGEFEVSSTRIRRELAAGRIDVAIALMGRPHRLSGWVALGDKRGATLGFPTANLVGVRVLVPAEGVYAGRTKIQGRSYAVACNIGPNPTFGVSDRKIEAHVIDFAGDLYGQSLDIDLVARIREVRRFGDIEELKRQLVRDIAAARTLVEDFQQPYGTDLGQTIFQWISEELTPSLSALGANIAGAFLAPEGRLRVTLDTPTDLPIHVWMDLLGAFEARLRSVFPEVRTVTLG